MARSYDALGLEETETCTILSQNDYKSMGFGLRNRLEGRIDIYVVRYHDI